MPSQRPHTVDHLGRRLCGAKTRSGAPCKQPAMEPAGRCRLHGGKSLRGLAHPSFKHGRYSRALPGRLFAAYEAARDDPELLSVRHEVALYQLRLEELLARLKFGDSYQMFEEATAGLEAYDTADCEEGRAAAISAVRDALGEGFDDRAVWHEFDRLVRTLLRLLQYEHRRLLELEAMIPADEVVALFQLVLTSLETHVTDAEILQRIQNDLETGLRARREGTGH